MTESRIGGTIRFKCPQCGHTIFVVTNGHKVTNIREDNPKKRRQDKE